MASLLFPKGVNMAALEKFTDDGVMMLLKHSNRQLKNDSNKDIVLEKNNLNYSINLDRNGLSAKEYYTQLKDGSYLYGRGSKREAEAVTCCSWVITLPKAVSDYSVVKNDEFKILDPESEQAFFEGVHRFVSDRYGTVFYNRVHYDEGGQPHIHIYFVPRTKLDHKLIHFKTSKTHEVIRTESGRYEFKYRFKLKNGEKIPLKNYAKMSDYYDTKISAADVINKAELQHFHSDLSEYLKKNHLPGADSVNSGNTGGKNINVKALKEFTKASGITIEELKEHPLPKEELIDLFNRTQIKPSAQRAIEAINTAATLEKLQLKIANIESDRLKVSHAKQEEIANKTAQIRELSHTLSEKEKALSMALNRTTEMEKKISEMENSLRAKQNELDRSLSRIKELEKEYTESVENAPGWGQATTSCGEKSRSGWGEKTIVLEDEKTW